MKKLILFIILIMPFITKGQSPLQRSNYGTPNGYSKMQGATMFDTIVAWPVRDTIGWHDEDFRKQGRFTIRPQDSLPYYNNGSYWSQVIDARHLPAGNGSGDVTTSQLADSLKKYLQRGDSVNAYATLKRLTDSINALEARIAAKGYLTSEVDGSTTNEIQSLSISGDTIKLSMGGYVILPITPEEDPVFSASAASTITSTKISDWDNHLSNTSNPHSVTLDQAAKQNPVTDTSVFIGWQDPGGIITLFGNSITADIYTNPPPIPYYAHIANRHGQTFKVHAHGGATYYRGYMPHNNNGGLMDSVANLEVMPTIYSKLIIELGFNDGCQYATSYDTTQIKLSLDSFVAQADIKGWLRGSIGALSAWYIPNPALCNSMTDNDLIIINTAIRNECTRLGIHYIDLHTLFANNQKRNLYFTDNVHWSSLGHYICADEVDRELYPQLYVKGNMLVDGVLYDNKGHQIIGIDTTGRKVIEGETGFDVLPDGKALVTVPFTKNYAGLRAGGVTFQGISTYNYFIGFNLHHNGTTYVTDTAGYSGMIQFADGEISYWQSTGSNTAGTAPTLEKRYKFSSNSRGFGFGGNPGNGGRDDFSGSAMQGDASKLQINFPTKIKYAPANSDGQIQLLIRHITDSFIQVVTSIPYSFVSNRLKYSGGANYTVPVFSGTDSLVASDIQDSSNHIGISQNPLYYSRFAIPYSDSMLSAKIGYWNIQSISKYNMFISNNSYYRKGIGTVIIDTGYDVSYGLYNSPTAAGGACFAISLTPYLQFGGQPQGIKYPFFRITNWGTVVIGYHNSASNIDTSLGSIIVTNTTSNPASADSIFLPNLATIPSTHSKGYAVIDLSGARGRIPNKQLLYTATIPVADVTGAIDTIYRKPGTDSVFVRINGVLKYAFKDSTAAAGSGVTSVTATSPIASSGGSTPNITIDTTTGSGGWHSYNYYKTVFANITHTHAESDVTNLTTDLAGKQPLDADLTAIAALTPTANDVMQYKAGAWTNRSIAQLKTDLALTKADVGLGSVENTALSTWAGSANINTVGTIGSGTWQGSTINTTYIDKSITINAQTGTTYTLQASDLGKIVQCTNASAITVTLPSGLGASFWCIIKQGGAGAVTLAASGTTIHNRQSYTKTAGQYASFIILPESTSNNYSTQGDMQ